MFHSVVNEFSRIELTAHQIELATFLARLMADLDQEQLILREEGNVVDRATGTVVANPRGRVVTALGGEILAMRHSLDLHGDAPSRVAARQTTQKGSEVDHDDELLAGPN